MSGDELRSQTIPCLVLTHGRDDICEKSLASFIDCDPRFAIDIVHNPAAEENGSFLEAARSWVTAGQIRSLTVFDANISNNAILLYLLANRDRYKRDYVLLTDGDIVAPPGLVDEQVRIFESHSHIFACGLRLDASRWDDSLPPKKESLLRFNTDRFETEDYVNSATGLWATIFRGSELFSIVDAMMANGIRFTDGNLKLFGLLLFQKRWVATKRSIGRELNRERNDYYDRKAVSTSHFGDHSPEPAGSRYATWNHDLIASATCWTGSNEIREDYPALPPAVARFRGPLESDPVVGQIAGGSIARPSAYVVNSGIRATQPGLALILTEGSCQCGIPLLPGDRSVLYIPARAEPGPSVGGVATIDAGHTLITRPLTESVSITSNLARLLGDGGTITGLMFKAEAARKVLRSGARLQSGYVPPKLREVALALAEAGSKIEDTALEAFVSQLWADENIKRFAEDAGYRLSPGGQTETDHLITFTLDVPAATRSAYSHELASS